MTFKEFKKRWLISKLHPIYFYLPYRSGKAVINPDKFSFSIIPMTQITEQTFMPIPQQATQVPYYSFTALYKNAQPCANLSTRYKTIVDSEEIDNLGCLYKIYKENTEITDDSAQYQPVDKDGKILSTAAESVLLTFFKDTQSVSLPEGNYRYREYISHEGDLLHKANIDFNIFRKDETYIEPETIVYDWKQEKNKLNDIIANHEYPSLQESLEELLNEYNEIDSGNPQNNHDLLFMHYYDYSDTIENGVIKHNPEGILHETYNGFQYFKISYNSILQEYEIERQNLQYKIYHRPKLIKVYVSYNDSDSHPEVGIVQDLPYPQYNHYTSFVWWSLWLDGLGPGLEKMGGGDSIHASPIHKIIPKINKITVMDNDYNIGKYEYDIHREPEVYNCPSNFRENKMESTDLIIPAQAAYCELSTITYDSYANKKLLVSGIPLTSSYIMSWTDYQASGFPIKSGIDRGYLYQGLNPTGLSAPSGSASISLNCCIGVGVYATRSGTATLTTENGQNHMTVSCTPVVSNVNQDNCPLNNQFYEVTITTVKQEAINTSNISEGNSKDEYIPTLPSSIASGVATPEDTAQFAMMLQETLALIVDTENPHYDGGYMIPRLNNNYPCHYRITGYEDAEGYYIEYTDSSRGINIGVKNETFTLDDDLQSNTNLYDFKRKRDAPLQYNREEIQYLEDVGAKAFGAAVIFSRQTRNSVGSSDSGQYEGEEILLSKLDAEKTKESPNKKKK